MTLHTALREQRLNIPHKIHRDIGRGREFGEMDFLRGSGLGAGTRQQENEN